jgi:hypothetical protein
MITALKQMLPRIESWPPDDQQALLEAARGIEAERSGVYHASPEELAAIDRGLDDSRHERFASASRLLKRFARSFVAGEDSVHGLRARAAAGARLRRLARRLARRRRAAAGCRERATQMAGSPAPEWRRGRR